MWRPTEPPRELRFLLDIVNVIQHTPVFAAELIFEVTLDSGVSQRIYAPDKREYDVNFLSISRKTFQFRD